MKYVEIIKKSMFQLEKNSTEEISQTLFILSHFLQLKGCYPTHVMSLDFYHFLFIPSSLVNSEWES